jgi:hypothetical protein
LHWWWVTVQPKKPNIIIFKAFEAKKNFCHLFYRCLIQKRQSTIQFWFHIRNQHHWLT